jgi:hypothetical protein
MPRDRVGVVASAMASEVTSGAAAEAANKGAAGAMMTIAAVATLGATRHAANHATRRGVEVTNEVNLVAMARANLAAGAIEAIESHIPCATAMSDELATKVSPTTPPSPRTSFLALLRLSSKIRRCNRKKAGSN